MDYYKSMDTDLLRIINYSIISISVVLIVTVLLQVRGSGVGSLFGGSGGEFYRSRRGMDQVLYYITIISAIILCALCIAWSLAIKTF